jgi:hypothetical protein
MRPPVRRPEESRAFTDGLLRALRDAGFTPSAWARFLADSTNRSLQEARSRPIAAAEVTALHLGLFSIRPHPATVATWLLSITHLGLMGPAGRGLAAADALTLARANLPALARGRRSEWTAVAALVSDVADGWLARRSGGQSAFGAYADSIADVGFWTWFTWRHEPSHRLRAAAAAVWLAAPITLTCAYFWLGRTVDYPRPRAARYTSAALQILIAVRALRR